MKLKDQESSGLGSQRGIKMDAKNHNWVILEEHLAIPFSYMSFVIKNFIETVPEDQRSSYQFDPEPYNYLLNKSTSFLDGCFVKTDPAQLHYILSSFDQLDAGYLEQLHYCQKIMVSAQDAEKGGVKFDRVRDDDDGMARIESFLSKSLKKINKVARMANYDT